MSFLLWQLVDSAFPAGGFAHSGGLEASIHHGQVTDSVTLRAFAQQALAQAGRSALPLVTAAHSNPENLPELDRLSDAFLSNAVANRASRAQGRAFLTSAARSFPDAAVALRGQIFADFACLGQKTDAAQSAPLAVHYAPIFGAVLNVLGVDRLEAQRLFLYTTGRGVGSAAVRLGLIGAYEAQQLQTQLAEDIDPIIERCDRLDPLDIAQTAPLIDLCQSTHDRLYSRLFQS